jgi:RHS repeat-associated protein
LDRPLTVTAQDNSATSYLYVGDTTSLTNTKLEIEPPPNSTTNGVNRLYFTDALGRLVKVQENVTSWQSQAYGQSAQPTYTTPYGYDVLDDLTLVCQNGTISSGVCGGGGQSRSFTYDSLKRLVQAVNPESGTITYSYDTSGNLSTRTDANSTVLTFSAYDGMNRATGKSYAPGTGVASTPSVSYTYGDAQTSCNLRGLLMQVTASSTPSMVNNYTCYDWAGRPTSSNQVTGGQTHGMSYGYDLAGLMKSFTLPSGRQQTITYDTAGRASGVSGTYGASATTYASAFSYFPNRALKNVSLGPGPNYLPQQYCQDTTGRLQIVAIRLGPAGGGMTTNPPCGNSNDALNLAFSYGSAGYNNGNLTSEKLVAPLNVTQNFTYDAENRLSSAAETGGSNEWSQNYKYDVYGNSNASLGNRYVSASVGLSGLPSSFTPTQNSNFNSNNQLSIQSSAYDNAGNLKTIGAYTFTYDAENRQVSATAGSTTTNYSYDGEGHRVQKVSGGVTTVYAYDAKGEAAAEYSTSPPTQTETQYLTADHLGSTRLVSSATGTALGYHDYLPFGEEIPAGIGGRSSLYGAADGVTQKFTGQERDAETAGSAMQGLDYFGARYFSGTMGRFTSPDWSAKPQPVPYADLTNPQSLNLYTYVRNSPLKNRDLSGHVCIFGIGNTCTAAPPPPPPPPAPVLSATGQVAQGPQPAPAPRSTQAAPALGGGLGVTAGGTAAVGIGIVGAATTGSGTAAVFANAQSGASVSAGLSASGGVMATAGQSAPGLPQQPSSSTAAGAFVGAGAGIVLTNAGTNQTLASTTTVFSFDVAFAFGGSIQVAAGPQGVTAISVTLGPGIGLAFTKIDTATAATGNQ